MKMHKQNNWRQLDDQAKIYSLSRNDYDTSIFRLSVLLKDKINKKILETAVIKTLEQYKAYKVKMEGGFFWYYLDANDKNPIVTEENDHPFKKINTIENNNYLFKVTYFDKKINIEFFHTLTDGNSGSIFFKKIIYNYLNIRYKKILKSENEQETILSDSENAYIKNYDKKITKAYNPPKAYMLKGKELSSGLVAITHFKIPLSKIKKYAKSKECSLSVLLTAMLAYSIYEENYKKHKGKKPINICIPIDLKKYFTTNTISNFVSYFVVSIELRKKQKYNFNDILSIVNKEFESKLKYKKIIETMSSNGNMVNNVLVRIVPLILKRIMVVLGTLEFKRHFSTTLSNLGIWDVKDEYKEYIRDYYFVLAPDWSEKTRCGVVSYNDHLIISFGTNLSNSSIERRFMLLLNKFKIDYLIETNNINIIEK